MREFVLTAFKRVANAKDGTVDREILHRVFVLLEPGSDTSPAWTKKNTDEVLQAWFPGMDRENTRINIHSFVNWVFRGQQKVAGCNLIYPVSQDIMERAQNMVNKVHS